MWEAERINKTSNVQCQHQIADDAAKMCGDGKCQGDTWHVHQTWPGCGQCGGWRRVNWHSSAAQHTPHYCSTRAGDDFSNFSQFLEKFIDLFKVPTSAFALKNLLHYTKRIFKHSKLLQNFVNNSMLQSARERFIAASSWLCGARP